MKPIRTNLSTLSSKALFLGIIAASAALPVQSYAAVGGTLTILYLYSQTIDNPFSATVVSCTSFSGVTETLQFLVKDAAGTLKANPTINIVSSGTVTAGTRATGAVTNDVTLATGALQGTLGVLATSLNVVCSASIMAVSSTVSGVTLHGARFNPISNTQE
jgi:hypothetical protein